jgi:MtN3 and saliva related transmembrane protein
MNSACYPSLYQINTRVWRASWASFKSPGVYYGLLIVSRPVIVWNMIGVVINFLNVGAYLYFVRRERQQALK